MFYTALVPCQAVMVLAVGISIWQRFKGRRVEPADEDNTADEADSKTRKQKAAELVRAQARKQLKWYFLIYPFYSVALLYTTRILIIIWNPEMARLLKHRYMLLIGGIGGLVYCISLAIIYSKWVGGEDKKARLKGMIVTISVMFLVYLASASYYSYAIYPQLPNGLGGGRPAPITLWVDTDHFPTDLPQLFPSATFSSGDKAVKCEHLYLLYSDPQVLILVAGVDTGSGVLLSRDSVKAIAW
jgi:hypothetical protein